MRWTWSGWGLLTLCACASGPGGTRARPPPSSAARVHELPRADERVTPFDLDHDGKPDVWDYTVQVPGPDGRMVERRDREELDMNSDGQVDLVKWFDAHDQLARETLDLDFDGKVDQVNLYEHGLISRKERDLDGDGRPDQTAIYGAAGTPEAGQRVREERDTNADGKVDVWEYYEHGRLVRVGKDLDFDGQVDQWSQGDATTRSP